MAENVLTPANGFGLWLMSPPKAVLDGFATAQTSPALPPASRPDAVLIDFDIDGKTTRQQRAQELLGHDTTISKDDSDLLDHALELAIAPVLVRLGRYQPGHTESMMRRFQDRGVVGFLLSMVEHESEIDQARQALDPGVPLGAMIETPQAIRRISHFRNSGLDFAFIGLVDLAIQRGSASIFTPLIDGTMTQMSKALEGVPFGFGAATIVGGGAPVPNQLLLAEMLRHHASYTLLRSAFYRDLAATPPGIALCEIREAIDTLHTRTPGEQEADFVVLSQLLADILCEKTPEGG